MAYWKNSLVVVLGLVVGAACERPDADVPIGAPVPTAVSCADAAQLRQRAADEQRLAVEATSDQEKIIAGNRAAFYTSLGIAAELKCEVTSAEADVTLTLALGTAGKAEASRSFYERAVLWTEAGAAASKAVSELVEQLSPSGK